MKIDNLRPERVDHAADLLRFTEDSVDPGFDSTRLVLADLH